MKFKHTRQLLAMMYCLIAGTKVSRLGFKVHVLATDLLQQCNDAGHFLLSPLF